MIKKIPRFLLVFLPIGYVELIWLANGQPFLLDQLVGLMLISLTALSFPQIFRLREKASRGGGVRAAVPIATILTGSIFFYLEGGLPDLVAYACISAFGLGVLICADMLAEKIYLWARWVISGGLALFFSLCVVGALQFIERFSEEEFFSAIQVLLLSGWWLALLCAWRGYFALRDWPIPDSSRAIRAVVLSGILLVSISGGVVLLNAYQASFYPQQAALFPGISEEKPFLCGDLSTVQETRTFTSEAVFQGIIERAVSKPVKTVPDLGMLALISQDPSWSAAFHQGLLKEAQERIYTGPAGSVKFGQYETALRAYYFYQVTKAFPALFTEKEEQEILTWFADVNRRSLTVEWVDWMYATAFGEWPKGPYLNQENGSSLLALLEAYHFSDPKLRDQNQAFLQSHSFGWGTHFRNTDDSIYYQILWINNAIFQSVLSGNAPGQRVQKTFDWIFLQAPPDGASFGYNPGAAPLAASAYLGAQMTGDGRFLWLAGQSLDYLQAHNLSLNAQPGLEKAFQMTSTQPEFGSCLLYGDSGTPIHLGPLAADKIVFRDGWQAGDRYLNLNLRFTGWHRYKATNAIISIYQGEPLISEQTSAPRAGWLPVGRSMFRDKRIPRENLNGLVISREGVSKLIYWLTGVGSRWAQDPPFYAAVDQFTTGEGLDQSVTSVDWNGWKQTRSIYFVHNGPTVIFDEAHGPGNQTASVIWHGLVPADLQAAGKSMENSAVSSGEHSFLLGSKGKVEMRLIPFDGGQVTYSSEKNDSQSGIKVLYTGGRGTVKLVTLFLSGDWREAAVKSADGFLLLHLRDQSLKIPLPAGF